MYSILYSWTLSHLHNSTKLGYLLKICISKIHFFERPVLVFAVGFHQCLCTVCIRNSHKSLFYLNLVKYLSCLLVILLSLIHLNVLPLIELHKDLVLSVSISKARVVSAVTWNPVLWAWNFYNSVHCSGIQSNPN